MTLALWMLTVSQFTSEQAALRAAARRNTHEEGGASELDDVLDDFVLWVLELRTRDGRATLRESYASFVFNMALLYFLYQTAIRLLSVV
jgi:hypothetical protein